MKTKLWTSLKILTIFSLIVVLILAVLTLFKTSQLPDEKIKGVVRVLMHDTSHYTLLIQRKNSAELQMRSIYLRNTTPRFIADVPAGQPMWVFLKGERREGGSISLRTSTFTPLNRLREQAGTTANPGVG
ncbi:MAG: hypothetical protein UY50_C0005G0016 [Parcubacteria group bacterium GW2011_GWA2_49_9]|nr:MAG: hypothetical protein UY50_C0005G0016 [Parcubacteria group bacterium GW2011_GWA2_49_9]